MPESTPRQSDILSPYVNKEYFDEVSRLRGNDVHFACKKIARGVWIPSLPLHQGYVDSFKNWFKRHVKECLYCDGWQKIEGKWIEVGPLESPIYRFHGTPDFIGWLIGEPKLSIADWKTSIAKQKVWQLQVSGAYRILAEENGFPDIGQCFSVRLDKDGDQAHFDAIGDLFDTAYFLRARDLYAFFNE